MARTVAVTATHHSTRDTSDQSGEYLDVVSETGGCSSRFRVALVVTINKDQRLALAVFASLDGDGDGCVTEAEARDIELTED